MKKAAILTLCAAFALSVHAQQFDWVNVVNSMGNQYDVKSLALVADSEGNLYQLMQGYSDAEWFHSPEDTDIVHLFPSSNYVPPSISLVSTTSDGQLRWHKSLYNWTFGGSAICYGLDLHMLADTAVMLMATLQLPLTQDGFSYVKLFYLDTLLTTPELLVPTLEGQWVTAFITLGLDGTLKEHHFLQTSWLDAAGQPIFNYNGQALEVESLSKNRFDVDSRGNIYVVRQVSDDRVTHRCDTCEYGVADLYFHNGGLGGYRFVVDGTRYLSYTPQYPTGIWNLQLLKFSPHFDTLLDATYVIDATPWADTMINFMTPLSSFHIYGDQLYMTLDLEDPHDGLPIARSDSLQLQVTPLPYASGGCLLRYDTTLHANLLAQVELTPHSDSTCTRGVRFVDTYVDMAKESSIFLMGDMYLDAIHYSTDTNSLPDILYRGQPLSLSNNDNTFWLRLNIDNGSLLSYGSAHSSWCSWPTGGIVAGHNRVFAHVQYMNDFYFRDTYISLPQPLPKRSIGLAVWDYDGHELAWYDYQSNNSYSKGGQLVLRDSSLYASAVLFAPGQIDSLFLPMKVILLHYGDTALMTDYHYDSICMEQQIVWNRPDTIRMPSPTHMQLYATATSGLPVSFYSSNNLVYIVYHDGIAEIWPSGQYGTCQITAIQPGNSYWNAAPPVTKTLIIGPTSNGIDEMAAEDGKVMVYPNPTAGKATVLCADPVQTAILTDVLGHTEKITLTPLGNGRYTLDLSGRPQAAYLLTLVTVDGQLHTLRLLKQSSTFGL